MRPNQLKSSRSTVRIVAGTLRGSRLAVADAAGLRPTPERVRETLFNWLAPTIDGARCLDLFAGTGALGIEAMSRGADECVFVERDAKLAAELEANLARLRVAAARVVRSDAADFVSRPATGAFDVVFIDPPFAAALWADTAQRIEAGGWLKEGGLAYVESPVDAPAAAVPSSWQPHREARAGAVRFALYRRVAADRLS